MRISALMVLICLAASGLLYEGAPAYADEAQTLYRQAVRAARAGDFSAAFMSYHALLDESAVPVRIEQALFAVGEYYYLSGNMVDAVKVFVRFVREYPDSPGRPFALVYLFKIAQQQNNASLAQDLRQRIVTLQQLSLLFRDHKKYTFRSPLFRTYALVYYIDKVECRIDGELFAQITY